MNQACATFRLCIGREGDASQTSVAAVQPTFALSKSLRLATQPRGERDDLRGRRALRRAGPVRPRGAGRGSCSCSAGRTARAGVGVM
jgi:hypothetical protein